jgi:Tfp pilus assembly protein PilO
MRIEKLVFTKDLVQKLVLGCILVFLFFYVDIGFVFKGQLRRRAEAGRKVKELRKDLSNLRAAQQRIRDMSQSQLETQKAKLAAGGRLITEDGVVALLQSIAEMASRHNVKINHIRPTKEAAAGEQVIKPLLITLDGTGEFHNAVSFINDLETGVFFIAVQTIRFTPQQDMFRQKFHLVLKTYVE